LPNRLPILAVLTALLLAACSSKDEASNGISIASAPPAEATAITATVTARSQSGAGAAVATVVAPSNVLTPRPGAQADIVAARRLESEGDIHGASEAYVAVASRQDRDSVEAYLGAARTLLAQDRAADAKVVLETFRNSPGGRDDGPSLYMLARAQTPGQKPRLVSFLMCVTPGIKAPLASLTVPVMEPWASASAGSSTVLARTNATNLVDRILPPQKLLVPASPR